MFDIITHHTVGYIFKKPIDFPKYLSNEIEIGKTKLEGIKIYFVVMFKVLTNNFFLGIPKSQT